MQINIKVLRRIAEIGTGNGDCEHKFLCPSSVCGDLEAIDGFLDVVEGPNNFGLGEGADHDAHEDGAEGDHGDDGAEGASVSAVLGLVVVPEELRGGEDIALEEEFS